MVVVITKNKWLENDFLNPEKHNFSTNGEAIYLRNVCVDNVGFATPLTRRALSNEGASVLHASSLASALRWPPAQSDLLVQ